VAWLGEAEDEVDDDGDQESNAENRGADSVVIWAAAASTNVICTPVVCPESIRHDGDSDHREHGSTDLSDLVTEVEKTDGQTTEDDGEVQP